MTDSLARGSSTSVRRRSKPRYVTIAPRGVFFAERSDEAFVCLSNETAEDVAYSVRCSKKHAFVIRPATGFVPSHDTVRVLFLRERTAALESLKVQVLARPIPADSDYDHDSLARLFEPLNHGQTPPDLQKKTLAVGLQPSSSSSSVAPLPPRQHAAPTPAATASGATSPLVDDRTAAQLAALQHTVNGQEQLIASLRRQLDVQQQRHKAAADDQAGHRALTRKLAQKERMLAFVPSLKVAALAVLLLFVVGFVCGFTAAKFINLLFFLT